VAIIYELLDYLIILLEETRWIMRPDHCWSMMSKQKKTDPSRTHTWSKCHFIKGVFFLQKKKKKKVPGRSQVQ